MARKSDKGLLVALDIGTSKVAVIVGEVADDGSIEIIGLCSRFSARWMRRN